MGPSNETNRHATQVPASVTGADALARHVAASYRLKDAAVRLNWRGRPFQFRRTAASMRR